MLALNVNSPSESRAISQLRALIDSRYDILVLTEVKNSLGGRRLVDGLAAEKYAVSGWGNGHFEGFTTLVASRVPMQIVGSGHAGRLQIVTLRTSLGEITLIGAYGPSSDPFGRSRQEKVNAKRVWLSDLHACVESLCCEKQTVLLVGDLNIVDSRDMPQYRSLYPFERQAYSDLLKLDLVDLFADTDEFTWVAHQERGFRFDHALATAKASSMVTTANLEHKWRKAKPRLTDHSGILLEINASFETAALASLSAAQSTLF